MGWGGSAREGEGICSLGWAVGAETFRFLGTTYIAHIAFFGCCLSPALLIAYHVIIHAHGETWVLLSAVEPKML